MITSTSNPHMKDIKHLRERKHRAETGLCLIEGIRIVYEALLQGAGVREILFSPELAKSEVIDEVVQKARVSGVQITEVSRSVFESLSGKEGPQGLAAVVQQQWVTLDVVKDNKGLWVALYEVADPGNLGAILRTCDATGAKGVVLIGNCTDPYDPAAVRASMGAVFSRRISRTPVEQFVSWVKQHKPQLVGTADKASMDYRAMHYNTNMILLMGSERQGIPDALAEICDEIVSIPMRGTCDSLNLAVATGVMLYEIMRSDTYEVNK